MLIWLLHGTLQNSPSYQRYCPVRRAGLFVFHEPLGLVGDDHHRRRHNLRRARSLEARDQIAFFAIVPGFIGAFVDHPVDRRVAKVLEVAQQAGMQPGDYLLPPGEKLASRVMSACAMHNNAQALNIATDLTYARYESAETGWFSWAVKPDAEGGKCFSEADQLALRSQRFKTELAAIKAGTP